MFARSTYRTMSRGARPAVMPASAALRGAMPGTGGTCVVRLVDRRTGLTHKINGSPLVVFTRDPATAVDELLEGRDRGIWEARIDPIEP